MGTGKAGPGIPLVSSEVWDDVEGKAWVLDPASLAVGTSALGDHHLVPHSGLGQPQSPHSTCSTSSLLASPTKGQAAVLGCFCRLLPYRRVKPAQPSFGSSYRTSTGQQHPASRHRESEARMHAGGSQASLLVQAPRSPAAEEGWEPSTSPRDSPQLPPAPAKAPTRSPASGVGTGWVLTCVPQPLHVQVMEHCSFQRRPSLPNWCKQGKLNKEKAEAAGHPACLCLGLLHLLLFGPLPLCKSFVIQRINFTGELLSEFDL